MFSPLHCALGWVFHIFLSLGYHIVFVTSLWILWGDIVFVVHMVGRWWLHVMLCEILSQPLREMWGFMSCNNKPMSFCPLLYSSHCQINILLLVDDVHTLANIIIIDPTRVDLVSWTIIFCGGIMTIVVQMKDGLYHDQFPINMFFPLDMKVFGCLH
jgi:hypothetical protein